jgi:hypothetical protein
MPMQRVRKLRGGALVCFLACNLLVSVHFPSICDWWESPADDLHWSWRCRALFGDQVECITTLLSWQNMCEEGRHFGRSLFDAEEMVLQTRAAAARPLPSSQ